MAAVTCHRARVLMLVWLSWVYESAGSMLDGQRRNERAEEERGGKGRGRARGTEVWFGRGGPSGLAMVRQPSMRARPRRPLTCLGSTVRLCL